MDTMTLNKDMFVCPEVASPWAAVMRASIMAYLRPLAEGRRDGGMMIWWVAIKESQWCNIVKQGMQYQQYASLLCAVVPDYFVSVGSLTNSFKAINKSERREMLDNLLDTHGPSVRRCLLSISVPRAALTASASMTDIIAEIAESWVEHGFNRQGSFVRRGQEYVKGAERICPAVSVVTYPDEAALREDRPSSVVAFEEIDGELTMNRVQMFVGKYDAFGRRHHPVLVARSVADRSVVELCDAKDFGLCMVNPDGSWHRVLSRSDNDPAAVESARQALFSGQSGHRVVVYHGHFGFTTLPDLLWRWGVCVRSEGLVQRSVLTQAAIRENAAGWLRAVGCDMNGYCVSNRTLVDLAHMLGVSFSFGYLPSYQLERCDLDSNEITINLSLTSNEGRGRFSLAHGFGHYVLHKPVMASACYTIDGEGKVVYANGFSGQDMRWVEWQANQFGRYLLMPDAIVRNLFERCTEERTRRMGYLFVDDNPWNMVPYSSALRQMSALSHVSMEALSYRLKELNLLVDGRSQSR